LYWVLLSVGVTNMHYHTCTRCNLKFKVASQYCPDKKTKSHKVDRLACIGIECRASYRF
jgi:hypothetical protein